MAPALHKIPWLEAGDPFPPADRIQDAAHPLPGLIAAGRDLGVARLLSAYRQGIFPWFSEGDPVLWWSPDPRMVLPVAHFRLHRSLRKTLQQFRADPRNEIRVDHAFEQVIHACAHAPRRAANGTWIVPDMIDAYCAFHEAGHVHSVETWVNGELTGGLYCIGIGAAVFGESMFSRARDASKIALAALVCICRRSGVQLIDCQQNTAHLASLGAHEISRSDFLRYIQTAQAQPGVHWHFSVDDWAQLPPWRLSPTVTPA